MSKVRAMKGIGLACALGAAAWAFPQTAWAAVASVQSVQGEVFVLKAGATEDAWTKVEGAVDVDSGDTVRTDNGTCALQYGDIAVFSVDPNSRVMVRSGESEDLDLASGKIKAKVDKAKVLKPFHVITPTAVAAIRGTDVDFGFNEDGQLTIDLHNGNVLVYNDEAGMKVDLGGKKSITLFYNAQGGILRVRNECGSDDKVVFSIQGTEYAESPCGEREIELGTEAGPGGTPNTGTPDDPENPDTHTREPLPPDESPVQF